MKNTCVIVGITSSEGRSVCIKNDNEKWRKFSEEMPDNQRSIWISDYKAIYFGEWSGESPPIDKTLVWKYAEVPELPVENNNIADLEIEKENNINCKRENCICDDCTINDFYQIQQAAMEIIINKVTIMCGMSKKYEKISELLKSSYKEYREKYENKNPDEMRMLISHISRLMK
jgi:hypothetical protein